MGGYFADYDSRGQYLPYESNAREEESENRTEDHFFKVTKSKLIRLHAMPLYVNILCYYVTSPSTLLFLLTAL